MASVWEFHVIDGLADKQTALAMKFHHASADALGAATLIGLLLDPDPSGRADLPNPVAPTKPPGMTKATLRTAARAATHPVRALKAGARALPYLDQVPMLRSLPGAGLVVGAARQAQWMTGGADGEPEFLKAPRTRFNGPLSPGRAVAYGRVDVADVKELKAAFGVSFNDVVVAAVAGGLRRRLLVTCPG